MLLFLKKFFKQRKDFPLWMASILTGILASLYAILFKWAEQFSLWTFHNHPYWMLLTTPLIFLGAFWICHRFAPYAQGSGIPQVLAATIQQEKQGGGFLTQKVLALKTIGIKILSSVLCVASGGALGQEGPSVHIAASLFYQIGQFFHRGEDKEKNKIYLEHWIISGGAAGVAAAFNTPLGGLVFAIEELSTKHFVQFKTSLIVAVIIAGVTAQAFLGSYLYLGVPKMQNITWWVTPLLLLIALVGGFLGGTFGSLAYSFISWRKKIIAGSAFWPSVLALLSGLLVVLLALFVHSAALGPGKEVIHHLLFESGESDWKLFLVRFFSPLISFLSGAGGGLLAPCLSTGATIGALVAKVFNSPHTHLLITLGMIAFLSGFTHAPFTSFVLVLEMTDRHEIIFPMMLVALIAVKVAKSLQEDSFYDKMKHDLLAQS